MMDFYYVFSEIKDFVKAHGLPALREKATIEALLLASDLPEILRDEWPLYKNAIVCGILEGTNLCGICEDLHVDFKKMEMLVQVYHTAAIIQMQMERDVVDFWDEPDVETIGEDPSTDTESQDETDEEPESLYFY